MKKLKIVPCLPGNELRISRIRKKDYDDGWWYFSGELAKDLGCTKGIISNLSSFPELLGYTQSWKEMDGDTTFVSKFKTVRELKYDGLLEVEVHGVPKECYFRLWVTNRRRVKAIDKRGRTKKFWTWLQRGLVFYQEDEKAFWRASYLARNKRDLV